jgi:hypothetical protein
MNSLDAYSCRKAVQAFLAVGTVFASNESTVPGDSPYRRGVVELAADEPQTVWFQINMNLSIQTQKTNKGGMV